MKSCNWGGVEIVLLLSVANQEDKKSKKAKTPFLGLFDPLKPQLGSITTKTGTLRCLINGRDAY